MEEWFTLAGEACGAIGHDTLALGCPDLATEVCLGRFTKFALPTLWNVEWDHVVT